MENEHKTSCVCWDSILGTCRAIEINIFRKHGCKGCNFYKTEAEYEAQTGGISYAEELKKTFNGRRKK